MNQDRQKILDDFKPHLPITMAQLDETARNLANCDVEAVQRAVKFVIQDKIGENGDQKWQMERLQAQKSQSISTVMKEFQQE